jgi:uncharacterized lipoprotein YddW (UPF0748 family)
MRKLLFGILILALVAVTAVGQLRPKPEREFRAAWIATVENIDFPTKKGLSPGQQKEELLAILELAKKLRLNALIFQVRPMADAVYHSKLEPWSEFLTGEMGRPQDFDPLEFLVTEAHKRGVLVHAWFNPYRAYHPAAKTISHDHVARRKPTTVRQYGKYMWLDPASVEAQNHSVSVIEDVVRRYDVDGVHFDDYFYPYPEKDAGGNEIQFPDDTIWSDYQKAGGPLSREAWRRANVNTFIEKVGRAIKRIRPDVLYGISPFGIWQPVPEKNISGFNAYEKLYADAKKWLHDGTVDYLTPQLYWETARKGQSFPVLLEWWKSQNALRRHVWPGIATYRIGSTPTFTASEIANQIKLSRQTPETLGTIQFSFKWLQRDLGSINQVLRDQLYTRDALIPESPWIKVSRPKAPRVNITRDDDKIVRAAWSETGKRRAFWFVVYAKDKDGWSYSILPASERAIALSADRKIEKIIVTSVDRLGRESGLDR